MINCVVCHTSISYASVKLEIGNATRNCCQCKALSFYSSDKLNEGEVFFFISNKMEISILLDSVNNDSVYIHFYPGKNGAFFGSSSTALQVLCKIQSCTTLPELIDYTRSIYDLYTVFQ